MSDGRAKIALENIILFKFPNIKGLKIESSNGANMEISYSEGPEKEEIINLLNEIKTTEFDVELLKGFKKSEFGFIPQ